MTSSILLPRDIFLEMVHEATRKTPLETGGILLGTWLSGQFGAHVSKMIGPGPNAVHELHSFEPDYKYQSAEVELVYRKAPKGVTYLGDWHTHPNGSACVSWRDRFCLLKIAQAPESCTSTPIMVIMSGPDEWIPSAWMFRGPPRRRWNSRILTMPITVLLT